MSENLIYGPVPSRRLGLSLGVDLVPFKTCSYNCVYCQIGPTRETTLDRKPYVSPEKILSQLKVCLNRGISPDHITLGGSGEPTLNSEIKLIIDGIKDLTSIPVAVITNGSLLSDEVVRSDISQADVVLPSLDAGEEGLFKQINRPHPEIDFKQMVNGLIEFRKMYTGKIWLEIFFIEGINATDEHVKAYARWAKDLKPDKIHLNTAVRPTAESHIHSVSQEKLQHFCDLLGEKAEVIALFKEKSQDKTTSNIKGDILGMLARRPCTLEDIAAGLNLHQNEILKYIDPMIKKQMLEVVRVNEKCFYQKRASASLDKKID